MHIHPELKFLLFWIFHLSWELQGGSGGAFFSNMIPVTGHLPQLSVYKSGRQACVWFCIDAKLLNESTPLQSLRYFWNCVKIPCFWLFSSGFEYPFHPDITVLICLLLSSSFSLLEAWGTQPGASCQLHAGPRLLPSPGMSVCFYRRHRSITYAFVIATILPVKKFRTGFSLFHVLSLQS